MSKPTKIPGIPKPAATGGGNNNDLLLSSMVEALEIRLGRRGDPRDRAITLRELIDSGLALDLKAGPFDPNAINRSNIGFGPGGNAVLSAPPVPTNFTAAGAYSMNILSWDYPRYTNHSHTEIWSYDQDIVGDATLAGIDTGRVYSDPVGSGVSTYYWIRHVSTANVNGPFNSATGTLSVTATDVAYQLDVLSGAITSSQLATELSSPISNLPADTIGSIGSLQTQISSLSTVAAWEEGTVYAVTDLVTYSSKLYECNFAHTASASNPPSGSDADNGTWTFVGEYSSLASAVAGNTSSISELNFVSSTSTSTSAQKLALVASIVEDEVTGVSANSTAVSGLTTRVDTAEGTIATQSTDISSLKSTVNDEVSGVSANSTAIGGLATRVTAAEGTITTQSTDISALESIVEDEVTGVSANSTAIGGLATRVTAAEGTITTQTSDISTLESTVNDEVSGVSANSTAIGGLATRVTAAEGTITTQTSDISTLESTVNDEVSGVSANSTAIGGLATRVTAAEGTITTQTSDISTLESTVNDEVSGVSANSTAIGGLATRVTAAEGTITTQTDDITALESTVNNETTGVSATSTAVGGLSTRVTAAEGTISTQSTDISNLNTTVGNNSSSIVTQASSIDGIGASFTLKTDVNGAIAGFGLANTDNGAGLITSEFIVNADRFAIMRGGSDTTAATVPFTVVSSTQTIAGETVAPGVYMADAFIKNGSIASAKIGELNGNKITAFSITSQNIAADSITASRLQLDSNIFREDSNGELILQTSTVNNGRGIATENLSYDATGAQAMATNSNYISVSNQVVTVTDWTTASPWYEADVEQYVYGAPAGTTTYTMPELLSLTMAASKLKESGVYYINFGASPIGSVPTDSSTSESMCVLSLQYKLPSSSTWQDYTQYATASAKNGILPLTTRSGVASPFLLSAYDWRFNLHGHLRGIDETPNGNRGFNHRYLQVFRIHRQT